MPIHAHMFHRVCVIGCRLDAVEHVSKTSCRCSDRADARHVGFRELEDDVASVDRWWFQLVARESYGAFTVFPNVNFPMCWPILRRRGACGQ